MVVRKRCWGWDWDERQGLLLLRYVDGGESLKVWSALRRWIVGVAAIRL